MCGRWRYIGGALVVALGVAVMPLQAQRGHGFRGQGLRGPAGPNMGHSLELALEHRDELELTQDQVAQLQELKATIDRDVLGLGEAMNELRESIRAGEVERDEGLRQMQTLRGELITASAPLRGRAQEILTVEQHNKLQPLARQGRPGGGRGGAVQGRGAFSARGRGMGMGMGMGMPGQPRGSRGGVGLRMGFRGRAGGEAPAELGEGGYLP
jgi:Spy/CpxP family protein refolding chaperone